MRVYLRKWVNASDKWNERVSFKARCEGQSERERKKGRMSENVHVFWWEDVCQACRSRGLILTTAIAKTHKLAYSLHHVSRKAKTLKTLGTNRDLESLVLATCSPLDMRIILSKYDYDRHPHPFQKIHTHTAPPVSSLQLLSSQPIFTDLRTEPTLTHYTKYIILYWIYRLLLYIVNYMTREGLYYCGWIKRGKGTF